MKYGISLVYTRADQWVEVARHAEKLGYDSVWMSEHLVFPIDLSSDFPGEVSPAGDAGPIKKPMSSLPVFDAPSALNHIAAATSTIRLGTFIYLLGIRHPFVGARAFQTVDHFSGGRVDLGVGAGWLESEWRAAGFDPAERGRRTEEAMAVCRRLWTEEVVEHHGEFWDFEPVAFEPKPLQSPLPIHMGGESPAALRRTAEYGNGWLAHRHTRETIQSPLERLTKALDKVGRTLDEIQISVARDPESLDDAAQWEEMGINRLIVFPDARKTGGDTLRALEVFAEQFIEPASKGA